ncbi:MAG: DUF2325 domain-containing protein [Zoogloea sp.]|nr:DUF2325 domain-containing protein [Zoogloea sp.]
MPKLSPLARQLLEKQPAALPGPGARTATAITPAPLPAGPIKRSKLWELEDKYHCPVIGTCIPMEELVKLARRFGFSASLRDEFALHVEAVGWSRSRNEVSEAIQRHLDKKYHACLARFSRLRTEPEVRQAWKDSLAHGEVAGPLWAACTHKAATAETRHVAYGDIHMLSHQIGAGQAADSRRLGHLEHENAELKRDLARERGAHRRQQLDDRQRIAVLEAALAEHEAQRAELDLLRKRLARFESGQVITEMGQRLMSLQQANEQLVLTAQRVWELDRTLKAAREEAERLARERNDAASERDAIERFLLAMDSSACDAGSGGQCDSCEHSLSPRCILYVGGRASLVAQYRELADRLGIRLVHHDGGQEETLSRLPELIHGADVVVCPTDCVSHSAYYHLKNHCKRAGKPCLFFKGGGVSSFALAMERLSRGEYSLAGSAPETGA